MTTEFRPFNAQDRDCQMDCYHRLSRVGSQVSKRPIAWKYSMTSDGAAAPVTLDECHEAYLRTVGEHQWFLDALDVARQVDHFRHLHVRPKDCPSADLVKATLWATYTSVQDHVTRFKIVMWSHLLYGRLPVEEVREDHKICGFAFRPTEEYPHPLPYVYFSGERDYPRTTQQGSVRVPREVSRPWSIRRMVPKEHPTSWLEYYFHLPYRSEHWIPRAVGNIWAVMVWLLANPDVCASLRPWITRANTAGMLNWAEAVPTHNYLPNCKRPYGMGGFNVKMARREYYGSDLPDVEVAVVACWILRALGVANLPSVKYHKLPRKEDCFFTGTPEQKQILMNAFPGVVV